VGTTAPVGRRPDVLEQPKPCQTVFQPPALDEGIFGSAFQEFRQKMLMGTRDD
jgi:hypothetical protein